MQVSRQLRIKAVQLIRSAKVLLARQSHVVPHCPKHMRPGYRIRRQRTGIVIRADLVDITPGHKRHTGGQAQRRVAISVVEGRAFLCQLVHIGRLYQRMPVRATIHRRVLIGHDKQNIRSIHDFSLTIGSRDGLGECPPTVFLQFELNNIKHITKDNILLLAYSHVAHDCVIEDDVVLTNQAALAGAVRVGRGAILGGYAIVHQYCSLGAYSFCAMGSAVNKDIPAFVKVRGNPATPFGINTLGLKRIGFSAEKIDALRSAYRTTYRSKLTIEEALKQLKPLVDKFEEVKIFANSVENSNRGIAR